ncbi:putative peptide chain release factor [unidentified eubacterium SCB49]|nr:putative peptide chain release factor [unidentified eubacterium SCB49]
MLEWTNKMNTQIIQITAGRGPAECCWVVAQTLKFLIKELTATNITYEIISKENGFENRTIQSVTLQLKGKQLDTFLANWLGTIQWVGTSTFRKHHKRKNWFIACFKVEETNKLELVLNEVSFQAMRSSGPGGQHVNKVSSAIRATHKKSGLQVVAMDSRSQHQNRKIAIKRLQEKVSNFNRNTLQNSVDDQWRNHLEIKRGNPVRVFKGTDFKKEKTKQSFKGNRKEAKNRLNKQQWD